MLEAQVKDLAQRLDALTTLLLDESDDDADYDPLDEQSLVVERKMRRFGNA
jgi:hypothetical protein